MLGMWLGVAQRFKLRCTSIWHESGVVLGGSGCGQGYGGV